MRRLICSIAFLSFALSLNASVPANNPSALKRVADRPVEALPALALTASPTDISFYEEFYPSGAMRKPLQPKAGVLHWIASLIKKAVRR
ncbi:MAG TPA: hypothetical protein VH724_08480 [Candidatus Angelobacter sp.]|nr:hypothetical protein [Candidatus Angelobacter sp.]